MPILNDKKLKGAMNESVKRWHDAYQKVLSASRSYTSDGVVLAFEQLVGRPPHPSDSEGLKIYENLLEDLRQMKDFEKKYPMAMVAFGGARLSTDNPYYELAVQVGGILATKGYLVRTGAGPGIMDAVPLGYKKERSRSFAQGDDHYRTQGVRIELPFEAIISPSIDVNTMMKTFAIRRTALIWNSRGIIVFPGGLGTINELFEAWNGAIENKVPCPIVSVPDDFYTPFFNAIEQNAVIMREIISLSDFNLIKLAHGANDAVDLLTRPLRAKDPGTQFSLREKLIYLRHELGRGLNAVSSMQETIVVMGPRKGLQRTDDEVTFIEALVVEILNTTSMAIRIGVSGIIDEVITCCSEKLFLSGPNRVAIQRVFMTEEIMTADSEFDTRGGAKGKCNSVNAHFESRVAHKETLIHNAKAAFFLPGDVPTMDVLFTLVCDIQTKRRRRIPVFLVGCEFWQPVVDGLGESLKGSYDGQFIDYSDMNIMKVIGTTRVGVTTAMEALI